MLRDSKDFRLQTLNTLSGVCQLDNANCFWVQTSLSNPLVSWALPLGSCVCSESFGQKRSKSCKHLKKKTVRSSDVDVEMLLQAWWLTVDNENEEREQFGHLPIVWITICEPPDERPKKFFENNKGSYLREDRLQLMPTILSNILNILKKNDFWFKEINQLVYSKLKWQKN